jgi:secreted trypsin-like serine protease
MLVCHNEDYNVVVKDFLAGIASFGPNFCGWGRFPAVFTAIAGYIGWINATSAFNPDDIWLG